MQNCHLMPTHCVVEVSQLIKHALNLSAYCNADALHRDVSQVLYTKDSDAVDIYGWVQYTPMLHAVALVNTSSCSSASSKGYEHAGSVAVSNLQVVAMPSLVVALKAYIMVAAFLFWVHCNISKMRICSTRRGALKLHAGVIVYSTTYIK